MPSEPTPDAVRLRVAAPEDIVEARQVGRALAARAGCPSIDLTVVATAISEIARNIVTYAGRGEIDIRIERGGGRRSLLVVARDEGPGIADVDRAQEDGFTTGRGLGLGLPGARRLMDEFEIESREGEGTVVTMRKWCGLDG
ncbi:MAG TPA: anti-sigma regulatory factor [Acidimicrobiales bacterium]